MTTTEDATIRVQELRHSGLRRHPPRAPTPWRADIIIVMPWIDWARASGAARLLAQRAGAAVVPYAVSSKPAPRLDSWDKFIIPLPFARGAIVFGPPIDCPREARLEDLQQALQTGMDAATRRAEELAGYPAAPDLAGAAL